jgi:hypothetical protein
MAKTAALANGPIELTSPLGQLEQIPIAALYFDSTNHLKADQWPAYAALSSAEKDSLNAWLGYLVDEGVIRQAAQPPPVAAMVITAKDAGSQSNNITIEFSNVSGSNFDAKLTETDVYSGLTPATVKSVIGSTAHGGTEPGLVYVSSAGTPTMPANLAATALSGSTHKLDVKESNGTTTAFTVKGKSNVADADLTKVSITDVGNTSNPPDTFTLTAVWTKTVTGVTANHLADSDKLGYEINVGGPPAGTLAAPAPGAVHLRGGSDTTAPTAASATVNANS